MIEKAKYLHKKMYLIIFICVTLLGIYIFFRYEKKGEKIDLNGHIINIEIADTQGSRSKGLSGREGLCEMCGMLFIFDELNRYGFWMKDMKFDIDIIWINNDSIVDISTNISHTTPMYIIRPSVPIDKVLELKVGSVDKFDLKRGQQIINIQ